MAETVFQQLERELDTWDGIGPAPGRPVFRSKQYGVNAYVDPFRKLAGTVVVTPQEGTPGQLAYFHELPPSNRLKLAIVTQAIGANMLRATGLRTIEHVEGYGVPDHPHTVLFSAARNEGAVLYQKGVLPEPRVLDAELDATQAAYSLQGEQLMIVTSQLEIVQGIAPQIDALVMPNYDALQQFTVQP